MKTDPCRERMSGIGRREREECGYVERRVLRDVLKVQLYVRMCRAKMNWGVVRMCAREVENVMALTCPGCIEMQ